MTVLEPREITRRGRRKADDFQAIVTATAMAAHIGCDRHHLLKLATADIVKRRPDGKYDLDETRLRYIAHLREQRKRSPRSEADVAFIKAKAELIDLRIRERKRELISAEDAAHRMEVLAGTFIAGLSSLPVTIAGRDLARRRVVEKAVFDLRTRLAKTLGELADQEEKEAESSNDE